VQRLSHYARFPRQVSDQGAKPLLALVLLYRVDFIEAENSMGFHASHEAMRILGTSIEHTRRGPIAIRAASR
jgi:hypothetical protein